MMAFGSYSGSGVGGAGASSSSSNLSALAPPFVVDKSFPKPNLNSSWNFTEGSFSGRSDPSFPIWHHHGSLNSASGPTHSESEPVGTSCEPTSNIYGCSGSEFSASTNVHYAPLNSAGSGGSARTSDPLPYYKYSNSSALLSTPVEPKPYYPPRVSCPSYDDSHQLAHQEPSYDLPSDSSAAQLGGSSQVGFPKNLSGIGYPSTWNQYSGVAADGEQRKWTDLSGSFGSKDYKLADTGSCRSYVRPEEHAADGLGSFGDANAVSDKCYDIFGRGYNFAFPEIDDGKPFLHSNTSGNNIECSQEPTINSIFLGSQHLQEPVLESTRNVCNFQNPHIISSANCVSVIGPSSSGGTLATKAPPVAVIKPPSGGSSKSVQSAKNAVDICHDFNEYDPFNLKDSHYSFGLKCQPNCSIVSTWDFVTGSAFNYGACTFGQLSKSEAMPPTPIIKSPDDVKSKSDGFDTNSSQKRPDGPDLYSHAVDSPCWKGAPAARMSPFDSSMAVASKPLLECDDMMNQGPQSIPKNTTEAPYSASEKVNCITSLEQPSLVSYMSTEDSSVRGSCQIWHNDEDGRADNDVIHLAAKEVKENTFLKQPSVTANMSREFEDSNSIQSSCHSKQNGEHGLQSIDNSHGSFGCNSKPDLNPKLPDGQQTETESLIPYKTNCGGSEPLTFVANEKNGKNTGTTSVDAFSSGPPSATGLFQTSSGLQGTTSCIQPSELVSSSKLDVNIVVNTMKNLSELLRCHCSNNPAAICQQDKVSLKYVINNLDACIGKEAVKNPLTSEVLALQQGALPLHKAPAQNMATGVSSEHEREKASTHLDRGKIADDMCPGSDIFRRRNKGFQSSFSLKENLDIDYSLIYAIKSVLNESVPSKGEKDPQTTLYKNLWLEAEASLCAITTRARLLRMKIEMENCMPHKEEDVEDLPISKVPHDTLGVSDPVVMAEACPAPVAQTHGSPSSAVDDESSLMARYDILNSRMRLSDSLGVEEQQPPKKGKCSVPSVDCQSSEISTNGIGGSSRSGIDSKTAASIMGRCHILNSRGDRSLKFPELQSPRKEDSGPLLNCQSLQNCSTDDANGSSWTTGDKNNEASVMSRFQIPKSRDEDSDHLSTIVTEIPQKDVDDSLKDTPAPDKPVQQNFFIRNTSVDTDNNEASILAKFHILQNRIESSNPADTSPLQLPVQAAAPMLIPGIHLDEKGFCRQGLIQQTNCSTTGNKFGSYPNWPENKIGYLSATLDANKRGVGNWLNSQVVEGWYDCSGSDWEHVPRDDLLRKI